MSAYMLAIDPLMDVVTGTNVQSFFGGPSSVQSRCYSSEQTQHMYGLLLISNICSGLCHALIHCYFPQWYEQSLSQAIC